MNADKMFDLSKLSRGVHRKYWGLADEMSCGEGRRVIDSPRQTPGISKLSKFNAALGPVMLKVKCMGEHHQIFCSPTGQIWLLDHMEDSEEREVSSAMIQAFGGTTSTEDSNRAFLDWRGKCRCEIVRELYYDFARHEAGGFAQGFPKGLREYARARRDLRAKRRESYGKRSNSNKRHGEPFTRKVHLDSLEQDFTNHFQYRCSTFKHALTSEIFQKVGLRELHYKQGIRTSFTRNFFRNSKYGKLYKDGFFFTFSQPIEPPRYGATLGISRGRERILVIAQKDRDSFGFREDAREVIYVYARGKDVRLEMGTAYRKKWDASVDTKIHINPVNFQLERHVDKSGHPEIHGAIKLCERALKKRFHNYDGEFASVVDGWEIYIDEEER